MKLETLLPRFLLFSLIGYLATRNMGTCPIIWRKNRFWLLIIIFACAYWGEYLLQFIPALHHRLTYTNIAADLGGALAGIVFGLRKGYRTCRCKFMVQEHKTPHETLIDPAPGPLIQIGHNPVLPAIITKTFGWKEVEIRRSGFRIGFICTGKGLVSYPHLSYGNIRFKERTSPGEQLSLLKQHLPRLPFSSVEVRFPYPGTDGPNGKIVSILDLKTDPWLQFNTNLRRKIRRSQKNGFSARLGGMELLDDFYRIYSTHIRSLGSAPLTRRWFQNLIQQYNNDFCGIFLLIREGAIAGAAFNLAYQGFYENCYFAVLKPHQRSYGSYALTHAMIEHARSTGASTYSFGRSTRNSGVHRFKQQWAVNEIPLTWLKYPNDKINLRQHTLLNKIWKTLPIPLRKPLDHHISKWIY